MMMTNKKGKQKCTRRKNCIIKRHERARAQSRKKRPVNYSYVRLCEGICNVLHDYYFNFETSYPPFPSPLIFNSFAWNFLNSNRCAMETTVVPLEHTSLYNSAS